MKNFFRLFSRFVVPFGACLSVVSSVHAAPADFQGEWFLLGPAQKTVIDIRKCDDQKKVCKITASTEAATDLRCSFIGELVIDSATHASHKSDYCLFDVTLTPGARPGLKVSASGEKCSAHCVGALKWPTEPTPLYQRDNFVEFSSACFDQKSPSMTAQCNSPDVFAASAAYEAAVYRADTAMGGVIEGKRTYAFLKEGREAILRACDKNASPSSCLIEAFKKESARLSDLSGSRDKVLNESGSSADARALIGRLEGVYKQKTKSGFVTGEEYTAEDVLEIVKVSDNSIYFKTVLHFYNGHKCGLSGVANYRKAGGFVYEEVGDSACRLLIEPKKNQISFTDLANCKNYCGARGSWNGSAFATSQKRKIKYLPTILKSDDYKNALSAFEEKTSKAK